MDPSLDPAPASIDNNDQLIKSNDPKHPANLIPELCKKFWGLGWVTGTGGGASIRDEDLVYLAPSGVQKEMMKPEDIYILEMSKQVDPKKRIYLRSPPTFKPSQCTPLFMAAFTKRDARCCIHSHSQWAVLVTLLLEAQASPTDSNSNKLFEINNIEQIKAFGRGYQKQGNLGYHDTLRIPVIENTPFEEDLTESLEEAMDRYPDTYAVLVRRHGLYVWGDTVDKAKAQAESLDYLFQLAVEMRKLGMPWLSDIA
ncbi:Methylthioribulose-1-phosphate dehydratase [Rhexocercosporidium sp. MPI-PUGE-AT-0058]|nr:Methylthioribulose-1-phosphate dehydratase [Rhexocercosporidium sp. MPI-PUGE-AT-0058]